MTVRLTEEKLKEYAGLTEAELEKSLLEAAASRKEEAKDLKRCKGRLVIHKDFLMNPDAEILAAIFRKFYPILISHESLMDEIVYFGYSYEFRPIEEASVVPMYRAIFTMSPEGIRTLQELRELDPDFIGSRDIEDGESDSLEKFEGS